jgi:hypothetical protein
VLKKIDFDYIIPIRFFSKLALAMGHLHFGETFSRSDFGEILRRHMQVVNCDDVRLPGAAIFPETDSVEHLLQLIAKEQHHVIAIMDGAPPVMIVSLFGEYGAVIPLGELSEGQDPITTGTGTVWRIELPSRRLSKLSILELFAERSEKARRKAREELGL